MLLWLYESDTHARSGFLQRVRYPITKNGDFVKFWGAIVPHFGGK